MTNRLTSAQKQSYWNDGILFPLTVLSPTEIAEYRTGVDRLENCLGGRPRTIELRQMHLHFPWAYLLATSPRILDLIEDLLGPNLLVWATEIFAKHPMDTSISIGWHRDRKYNGFSSQTSVTAWVALSPSTVENGCLKAVPGPYRADADQSPDDAINVTLLPGQMSLHDADILHGSDPNHSHEKRVGFAIRYVTPEAFQPWQTHTLVLARGTAHEGIQLAEPPRQIDEQLALGQMKESASRHLEEILQNLKQPAGAMGS